jgi:hypothetical protein
MRQICTIDDLRERGLKRAALERGWRRIERGVYGEGRADTTVVDRALAAVVATGGVASGAVAAALHGLDGVVVRGPDLIVPPDANGRRPGARRRALPAGRVVVVSGYRCTDGLQTLIDLAAELSDALWEQALESALRKSLTSLAEVEAAAWGCPGAGRVRRVLPRRPPGAPPTESLLETLMVQLARTVDGLPDPVRQLEVFDADERFVARVDLAWPEIGVFVELDGQHHKDQPVHDARRQTAVTAATGWLCARFTWHEVVHVPTTTARRLAALADQARRRQAA